MISRSNLAMVNRVLTAVFVFMLGMAGGVTGGTWGHSHSSGDVRASESEAAFVAGAEKPVAPDLADEDLDLLVELTREGIENGRLGLQGRLVSGMRTDARFPHEFGFEEVEVWVERNVRWEVVGLDRERSVGEVAVMEVRARGQGTLGREFENAAVAARFIVMYGMGGEFPGLLGFRADGPPFVVWGILSNDHDWRVAVPE